MKARTELLFLLLLIPALGSAQTPPAAVRPPVAPEAAMVVEQAPAPAPTRPPAPATLPPPSGAAPRPPHDPLGEALFPPELVMRHQQAIGLQPDQKTYLREQIRQAQLRFTELQWQLEDAAELLRSILEKDRVDESQALAALERVLDAERQIKTAQITLMVRIKNKLSPEQQARLRELRSREGVAPEAFGPRPGPPPF